MKTLVTKPPTKASAQQELQGGVGDRPWVCCLGKGAISVEKEKGRSRYQNL